MSNITDIIIILLFLFLLLSYIFFTKTNTGKGKLGEITVSLALGKTNIEEGKFVLNDFAFRDGDRTVQIDHILGTTDGIFVIETKNYSGKIYGNENMEYWKQYIKGKEYKIYSPIRQNYNHIASLRKLIDNKYFLNSIIVIENANISKISSQKIPVVGLFSLNKTIENLGKKNKYSISEIKRIYSILLETREKDEVSSEEHKNNVKKYVNKKLKEK